MEQATTPGLYTKEQQDYVNGVKDEDLRTHLLHQVRLRENMEADRDVFEKIAGQQSSLEKSLSVLSSALNGDKSEGSYYYSWQANIAMAFKDKYDYFYKKYNGVTPADIHQIANEAAKNFLNNLIK